MPFDNADRPGPGRGTGERAINLPPAVLWLIGINVAVHLLRMLLTEEADTNLILSFGLVPAAYTGGSQDLLSQVAAPITYQFLHGGWMHLVINMVTLAAFGAPVERLLGVRRFILFYLSSGVVAAFVQVLLFPDSTDPVIGASGAISGVFGGVLMLMRYVGSLPSLLPVAGIWIALNVFFGIFGGAPGSGGEQIAWAAHIGGFVYGLLAIRFFAPRQE
ncbi:MAG: rhomboid family intramembrane serine protease [Reyranella sp.]|nr:rhomboid family intramembrane serine protease [Reyranella sp.]MBL6653520.1 rhomboid family intramembrane serine protease [Reyranella sp.]